MRNLFSLILLAAMIGCVRPNVSPTPDKTVFDEKEEVTVEKQKGVEINTFSEFPPEIEGCACYFAADSAEWEKGNYIFMNNYVDVAYLKINGELVRFSQTQLSQQDDGSFAATGKSDNYTFEIRMKEGSKNGDETTLNSGTIFLKDRLGNIIELPFYGECGC